MSWPFCEPCDRDYHVLCDKGGCECACRVGTSELGRQLTAYMVNDWSRYARAALADEGGNE